jgi:cytochrome b561
MDCLLLRTHPDRQIGRYVGTTCGGPSAGETLRHGIAYWQPKRHGVPWGLKENDSMTRYSRTMVGLHWLMAIVIMAAWITSEGGRHVRDNPPVLHFWLGLSVLVLIVPRLSSRLIGGTPPAAAPRRPMLDLAAKVGHWILYALMVALPLTGWYAAGRLGVPVTFFGIPIPSLATPVQGAPGWIAELHETGGTVLIWLAGIHAVLAVWHQFVLRDGTLTRMSPI